MIRYRQLLLHTNLESILQLILSLIEAEILFEESKQKFTLTLLDLGWKRKDSLN